MNPPPCLCKVDCGAQQGVFPFLLLTAVAALIAFLVAVATAPKQSQSSLLRTAERRDSTVRVLPTAAPTKTTATPTATVTATAADGTTPRSR